MKTLTATLLLTLIFFSQNAKAESPSKLFEEFTEKLIMNLDGSIQVIEEFQEPIVDGSASTAEEVQKNLTKSVDYSLKIVDRIQDEILDAFGLEGPVITKGMRQLQIDLDNVRKHLVAVKFGPLKDEKDIQLSLGHLIDAKKIATIWKNLQSQI